MKTLYAHQNATDGSKFLFIIKSETCTSPLEDIQPERQFIEAHQFRYNVYSVRPVRVHNSIFEGVLPFNLHRDSYFAKLGKSLAIAEMSVQVAGLQAQRINASDQRRLLCLQIQSMSKTSDDVMAQIQSHPVYQMDQQIIHEIEGRIKVIESVISILQFGVPDSQLSPTLE